MKTLLNQMLGREPEPMWMAAIGVMCVFALPFLFMLYAVALGVKP